jgi:hypothetical protein
MAALLTITSTKSWRNKRRGRPYGFRTLPECQTGFGAVDATDAEGDHYGFYFRNPDVYRVSLRGCHAMASIMVSQPAPLAL